MRWLLITSALVALASATPTANARLRVQSEPLYARDGVLLVHLVCEGDVQCDGRVGIGRSGERFAMFPETGTYVRLRARRPGRAVRLVVRRGDGPTRGVVRRVRHRADPVTCGYHGRATTIAGGGGARILRADRDSADPEADVVLCRRGTAYPLDEEGREFASDRAVVAAAVTDRWAAVATFGTAPYGNLTRSVSLVGLDPPHDRGGGTFTAPADGVDPPVATARVLVADDGATVLLELGPNGYRIRAEEAAGERVLDDAVDRESLRLDGQTVSWTRGGVPRSAVVAGLPRAETRVAR